MNKKHQKVFNRPPEPMMRPGMEKKPLKFTSTADLKRIMGQGQTKPLPVEDAATRHKRAVAALKNI